MHKQKQQKPGPTSGGLRVRGGRVCVDGEEIQAEKLEGAGERGIEMSERLELNGTRGGGVWLSR